MARSVRRPRLRALATAGLAVAVMGAVMVGGVAVAAPADAATKSAHASARASAHPVAASSNAGRRAAASPNAARVNAARPAAARPNAALSNTSRPATTAGHTAVTSTAAPYGRFGLPFDIDPANAASVAAASAGMSAADRAALAKLGASSVATWFGDWNADVQHDVAARVAAAASRHAVAVLVAYNVPYRDCGGYSANAAQTAAAYRAWIRSFAAGLAGHPAIVIVEPDALAGLDCLTPALQSERLGLIRYAVDQIEVAHSWAYIDAGHSAWQSVGTMVTRLKAAGIADAAGFSLNVSNFRPTPELITYGAAISAQVGGAHFVIDTSRNGVAPTNTQWCNPAHKGLGARPTTATASPLVDAYLWIKPPGTSDGTCNGGPAAGVWFPSYALMLARNAAF